MNSPIDFHAVNNGGKASFSDKEAKELFGHDLTENEKEAIDTVNTAQPINADISWVDMLDISDEEYSS